MPGDTAASIHRVLVHGPLGLPGRVVKVLRATGETVAKGDPVAVLEAMKMEHVMRAPAGGPPDPWPCASMTYGGPSKGTRQGGGTRYVVFM